MGVNAAHSGSDLRTASFLARTASPSRPSAFHFLWHIASLATILWLALRTRYLTHVIITIRSSSSNSSDYLSMPPVPCVEEAANSTAVSSDAAPRVVLFHHIVAMNQWQHVVRDQLSKVVYSGLYDRMAVSYATCSGPSEAAAANCTELVQSFGSKFKVMDAPVLGEEDELMERRTLNQITNRTRRGDLVFYYHSKGVSSRRVNQEPDTERRIWQWRQLMEYFLIKRYQACIDALQGGSDAVGVNMRAYGGTRIVKQFSGNFWWATAEYYAHLEASQPMAKDYLGPENYVLKQARNVTVLWKSGLEGEGHYNNDYPPIRYMDRTEEKLLESVKIFEYNVTV